MKVGYLAFLVIFAGANGDKSSTRPPPTNSTSFTVGTVLFSQMDLAKDCWSPESVALLTSRMLIRNLMPHVKTLKVEDDKFVMDIIDYFRLLLEVIRQNTNGKIKHFMLLALTDALGGYMKHLILPISKYSFYAGNVQYASIIKLYQLYDELKNYLKTNGNTWARPWKRAGRQITAKAISMQSASPMSDPCKGIIYYKHPMPRDSHGSCSIDVPMPFFDSKSHPSAIAVPFKTFGLRNLESRVSSYILVKFYVAVTKCMASRNAQDADVEKFNNNMLSFISAKVMPHLCDDKFFVAFGGVLRILETIRQHGKKSGVHALGNFNILPEIEDREPFPDMDDTEDTGTGYGKDAGKGSGGSEMKKKNNLILLAALATIIIWFCLGAAFVCCRIRVSKMKKGDGGSPTRKTPTKDSVNSKPCPVLKPFTSKRNPPVCTDNSCPAFQNSSRSTIVEAQYPDVRDSGKIKSTTSKSASRSTEGDSDSNLKAPELRVHQVQYYPPSYACHTSMTGKVKVDSSTEEYTSRDDGKRPYVFGYDFQTTSEETSPRETTDGENEMGGNMSK